MSPRLELTEIIEKYLLNELSPQERAEFESRMRTDAKLKLEVDLQREVMTGIERAALKQKAQKAWKQYKTGKNLWNWGLSGLAVILAAGAVLYYMNSDPHHHFYSGSEGGVPALNEKGETAWADADRILPPQIFSIEAHKDTVIVTQGGIVMAIPANVFVDENGKPVSGTIAVEVKEALDPADIIKAGLSTKSNDEPLETGGMFYINARKDDASLKIDPGKGIYTQIPVNEIKPGMMLFEGERMPDGTINWINPKQLVKELLPVDIASLNFYPPYYIDSLERMGYDRKNKKFTDSLYYSFASEFDLDVRPSGPKDTIAETRQVSRIIEVPKTLPDTSSNRVITSGTISPLSFSGQVYTSEAMYPRYDTVPPWIKGINPAKVKAIWNKKFQNTNLSTHEFEMRMKHIHRSCENAVLDLYVNNLDKNLCTIDSMAAKIAGSQVKVFLELAARGDGKVNKPAKHLDKLREFYEKQTFAVTEAAAKTQREYRAHNMKQEMKRSEQEIKNRERQRDIFMEEYSINLESVQKQWKLPTYKMIPNPVNTYKANVVNTGWCNIDRMQSFAMEVTQSRSTLGVRTGGTNLTVLRYTPMKVKVSQRETYDRVLVYLLPDKLSSFMRMKEEKNTGTFTESRNELLVYKLVALGYRGADVYMFTQDVLNLDSYTIDLVKTTPDKADQHIRSMSSMSVAKSMSDELAYQAFDIKDAARRHIVRRKEKLRARIRPVVFPCDAGPCDSYDLISGDTGERLFKQNCAVCHNLGENILTGPGLGGITYRIPSKNWFFEFVKNPDRMKKTDSYSKELDKLYSNNMNAFDFLSDCDIEAIYRYLE
jgi:hypothetical protein